ncbi:hypothetical protein HMPREF9141_0152 [Prevotella multiformis DSM 16608]|uniref:Uncharacterized protein n=1 Tax=Prevotella multiformis DSM 16608 TaxID=888743 RepID=F0F3I6_9BACT|nr:hypothetical protein HMPREF9141_0152 [Prevotella multiformis DSM 16608]
MFLFIESLRFFRESYVKSIHAFDGRTDFSVFLSSSVMERRSF